jgi:hypothetical protein
VSTLTFRFAEASRRIAQLTATIEEKDLSWKMADQVLLCMLYVGDLTCGAW